MSCEFERLAIYKNCSLINQNVAVQNIFFLEKKNILLYGNVIYFIWTMI